MQMISNFILRIAALAPQSVVDRIGFDKVAHIIGGVLMGLVGSTIGLVASVGVIWGFVLALAAGVLKEVLDYFRNRKAVAAGLTPPHGVEFADAFWTVVGSVPVVAVFLLFGAPLLG